MFNNEHFRKTIIRPSLDEINLYSPQAEELLIAIMAHESKGGTFLEQEPSIPLGAHGVYQMESFTHDSIWNTYVSQHASLARLILNSNQYLQRPSAFHMIWNLKYATQMARLFWLRVNDPLPEANDIDAIAKYWKVYWNTSKGKGKIEDFVLNYKLFIGAQDEKGRKSKA